MLCCSKIPRVYRRYDEWEEVKFNMWGGVDNINKYLEMAIKFTGNHKLYGLYMNRVVDEWPVSCENALTDYSINRKAWIGHAATALAIKCPEDVTRKAWKYLTYEQQVLANKEASVAIARWEWRYRENNNLCENVGNEVLSIWDT